MAKAAHKSEPDEIDGITDTECCFDCKDGHCMITQDSHCAHPKKGGLQAAHMGKPDVVQRFNRARKILAHQSLDKKE